LLESIIVDSRGAAASLVATLRHRAASQVAASTEEIQSDVAAIIKDVRLRGDEALIDYTKRFDGVDLSDRGIEVPLEELDAAVAALSGQARDMLESAIFQIRQYFEAQYAAVAGEFVFERGGFDVRFVVRPIAKAGIYVPGGRYRYPSTVFMTVVPAEVAGVEEIVICTPPSPDGTLDPAVAAAARLAGAERVFMLGGVQAIAALAYGTQSVPAVDLIAGPGNAYVACAKKMVVGDVGIDAVAGPSELVVVAGDSAPWDLVAADLTAQAEHGPGGLAIAVVFSDQAAASLNGRLAEEIESDGRKELEDNLKAGGAIAICRDEETALAVVEQAAPEHVQIMLDDEVRSEEFAARIASAGAVFIGAGTPAAFGDYVAGPSHVLPTGGSARFSSGLGVYTFLRFHNNIRAGVVSDDLVTAARELARTEGMHSHLKSLELRPRGGSIGDGAPAGGSAENGNSGEFGS
jgi:histidinol dehydrogenase